MTYTPEELREAILISVCLGLIIGGCLGFIWAAWMIEAKATGRIDPRQAASILGKRGRAKQLRTQAEKQAQTTLMLMDECTAMPSSAFERYNSALNQGSLQPGYSPNGEVGRWVDLHAGQGR